MITARRAMPPIIKAIELVLPVIGRSYSPAFLARIIHESQTRPWDSLQNVL